jgi:hypothetical protein
MDILYTIKRVIVGFVVLYLFFICFGLAWVAFSEHTNTLGFSLFFWVLAFLILFYGFYYFRKKRKDKSASEYSRYIPSEVKQQVWTRDGGKCVLCGSKRHLEYDHELPVSKGGSDTVNNIRILCKRCNRKNSGKIE